MKKKNVVYYLHILSPTPEHPDFMLKNVLDF